MSLRDRFPEAFEDYEPDPELFGVLDESPAKVIRQALVDNFNAKFGGEDEAGA